MDYFLWSVLNFYFLSKLSVLKYRYIFMVFHDFNCKKLAIIKKVNKEVKKKRLWSICKNLFRYKEEVFWILEIFVRFRGLSKEAHSFGHLFHRISVEQGNWWNQGQKVTLCHPSAAFDIPTKFDRFLAFISERLHNALFSHFEVLNGHVTWLYYITLIMAIML